MTVSDVYHYRRGLLFVAQNDAGELGAKATHQLEAVDTAMRLLLQGDPEPVATAWERRERP